MAAPTAASLVVEAQTVAVESIHLEELEAGKEATQEVVARAGAGSTAAAARAEAAKETAVAAALAAAA